MVTVPVVLSTWTPQRHPEGAWGGGAVGLWRWFFSFLLVWKMFFLPTAEFRASGMKYLLRAGEGGHFARICVDSCEMPWKGFVGVS